MSVAYAVDDTQAMRDLQDRLERNKAEIIKGIKDVNALSQNATSTAIDQNFGVLDKRIAEFFKTSKREIAIIMVAGFLVAFTLSQIIRISIEKRQRKGLVHRALELESVVQRLDWQVIDLTTKVRQLKALDEQYSQELKKLARKEPFISIRMVLFGIFTLLVGVLITYLFMGGRMNG
jgi:hypothetical protein